MLDVNKIVEKLASTGEDWQVLANSIVAELSNRDLEELIKYVLNNLKYDKNP